MGFADRLRDSSRRHQSRIVIAPDLVGEPGTRANRAADLLEKLGDHVAGVKLNFHVILPGGLAGMTGITSVCARKQLPLIADIKMNDIESTNLEAVRLLFGAGFDAVIANPFVGAKEGLGVVIREAHAGGKGILLLVYMSHTGAEEGYGLEVGGEPLYVAFANRVRDWRADGAIVSSKSPEIIKRVRQIIGPEALILSPGIGFQGGEAAVALRAGTDFAIVGRSVIENPDPLSALEAFNRKIAALS